VTGVGVNVNVGVLAAVSVGCGVKDGVAERTVACVAPGAQAFKRRRITNREEFFIDRLDEYQPP
jgi:hypothetical protein